MRLRVSLSSVRFGRQGAWLVHGPHAERREQPERALSSPLQRNSSTTSSGSVTALQLALLLPKQVSVYCYPVIYSATTKRPDSFHYETLKKKSRKMLEM